MSLEDYMKIYKSSENLSAEQELIKTNESSRNESKSTNIADMKYIDIKKEVFTLEESTCDIKNFNVASGESQCVNSGDKKFGFNLEDYIIDNSVCDENQKSTSSFEDVVTNYVSTRKKTSVTGQKQQEPLLDVKYKETEKCIDKILDNAVSKDSLTIKNTGFQFVCDECNKSFSLLLELRMHIKDTHKRIRKYTCEKCGNGFYELSYLKRHILIVHAANKDFSCILCEKDFSFNHELQSHIKRIHQKIKNLMCEMCGEMFIEIKSLKKHVFTKHKRTTNYVCEQCNKDFYKLSDVNSHIDTVHKKLKKFHCLLCDKRFPI